MFAYVNGQFVEAENAVISIQDRGLRFGDGVFETIAVHEGIPYQWELHEKRLLEGLQALRIPTEMLELKASAHELLLKNDWQNGLLRIMVTRGEGSRGYLPTSSTPSVIMETMPMPPSPPEATSLYLSRYHKPSLQALPVQFKLMQGLNSTLAKMEAQEHDCYEALQCNDSGEICEASSGNIFWFSGGKLYTPALECGIVQGTIREAILRLYEVEEGHFSLDVLQEAEEVFITNTAWQVLPVEALQPQGITWASRRLTHELRNALQEDIRSYVATHR